MPLTMFMLLDAPLLLLGAEAPAELATEARGRVLLPRTLLLKLLTVLALLAALLTALLTLLAAELTTSDALTLALALASLGTEAVDNAGSTAEEADAETVAEAEAVDVSVVWALSEMNCQLAVRCTGCKCTNLTPLASKKRATEAVENFMLVVSASLRSYCAHSGIVIPLI
ncbi:hypothetical protein PC9H_011656 [Pleurotus ostreatus]|uniref:Uncharacterized protein n=1 Tax=Pleurotus ostreatus TaxID=5322 RepID=A0A8H7DMZ8_PLEOS|nr:uncharacterized protein PC9H_011656 [Pleurotus ostreatus]KAF7421136.1 hypothetical protein PC9H_011656 [Pleurotus ostreatus]